MAMFGSVLTAALLWQAAIAQPQVEIDTGVVEGRRIATHYEHEGGDTVFVNSFYGVPFGAPPVGDRRFTRADPAEPWEGVFEAKSLGTSCMQGIGGMLWLTHPGYRDHDEDCLNLNVFTPEDMDASYPVMLWFYGGGYMGGSNIQYPGHFLAARDVVVVAVNYRVGIFGFINTGDDVAPGNYGLWDQHLAMEWVQRNIANFGGDPNQVTLFGQSAGGSSSSLHIVSPYPTGMFQQVIAESGTDMNFWSLNYPASDPPNYTRQVAARLDCPEEDTQDMVDCLRTFEQWELRNNSGVSCTPGHFCQGHAPVVDGPGGYIPDLPLQLRTDGDFNHDINILNGYLSDDGSFYTVAFIPEAWDGGFNRSQFQRILRENLLDIWAPQFTPEVQEDAYWATDFMYTPWPYLEDKELNRDAFNMMITDAAFGYLTDKQLRSQVAVNGAKNYKYLFGFRPNATLEGEGVWNNTEWAGVPHAAELPFVFGWANMKLAPQVRADSRILIDILDYREEDFAYADFVMDLWTNFAKYSNPTPEPVEKPLGGGTISWDEWTLDNYNMFSIRREVENVQNYRADYNAFFEEYLSYIVDIPLKKHSTVVKPAGGQGVDAADAIWDAEYEMVRALLTTRFPGEYDHLYEEDE